MRFAGYAAVFDWPDKGGDVVRAGAFKRALQQRDDVPLLWQHRGKAIGTIEHLSEDRRGLRVIARVSDPEAGARLQRNLQGLSFGYRVREARNGGAFRELIDLDLVEVSLVAWPMQPKARVHATEPSAGMAKP